MGSLPNLSSSSAAKGGTVGPASYGAVQIGTPAGGITVTLVIAIIGAGLALFAWFKK